MDQNTVTPQVGNTSNWSSQNNSTENIQATSVIEQPSDIPPMLEQNSPQVVAPVENSNAKSKSSPIFIIALILMILTALGLGGYYVWFRYFSYSSVISSPTPIVTINPTVKPTAIPEASNSATPIPTASASPVNSASPSATLLDEII